MCRCDFKGSVTFHIFTLPITLPVKTLPEVTHAIITIAIVIIAIITLHVKLHFL